MPTLISAHREFLQPYALGGYRQWHGLHTGQRVIVYPQVVLPRLPQVDFAPVKTQSAEVLRRGHR